MTGALHVNPESRLSTVSKTTSDADRKLLSGSKPPYECQGPDTVSSDLSCGMEGNTIKQQRGTEDENAWPGNTMDGQARSLNAVERKEYGIQKSYSTVNDVSHGGTYSRRGTSASPQLEELDCGHPGRQTTMAMHSSSSVKRNLSSLILVFVLVFLIYWFGTVVIKKRNEELSKSFQNVLIEDLDELYYEKAAQDDPRLVTLIRQYLLEPGSVLPYNLTNNTRQDYSQGGQSTYVDGLLDHMENGFFVESGALDGERNSNSLLFERTRHWTGLLVEPNPYSFKRLTTKHRKAFSINACLSPHPYPAQLPMTFAKHPGRSYLNRYTPTHITGKKRNREEVHLVQCFPLYSILLASGRTHIQYISLDIEGAEMSVLKTIPWDKVDIKVFQIERNHIKEGPEALVDFMATKGYKKLPFVVKPHGGQDTIFVKDGFQCNKAVV